MSDLVLQPIKNRPYSGRYQISFITKERDVVGAYKVRLFDQETNTFVVEAWSAIDGTLVITNLANRTYFAVAIDHTEPLRIAAIQDSITPEAM